MRECDENCGSLLRNVNVQVKPIEGEIAINNKGKM